MSLQVLKQKSRRFENRISGKDKNGFSLNGGYRNQGWIGQQLTARSITYTPYRGNIPMGNGGNNGEYKINVVDSGCCGTNNVDIIKRSNMNTKGLLNATVIHPTGVLNASCINTCVGSQFIVKPHVKTAENLSQSLQINTKAEHTLKCEVDYKCIHGEEVSTAETAPRSTQARKYGTLRTNNPTYDHKVRGAISASEGQRIKAATERNYM